MVSSLPLAVLPGPADKYLFYSLQSNSHTNLGARMTALAVTESSEDNICIIVISDVEPRFPIGATLPWTGEGEPLEKFTLFPELPLELRLMICKYSRLSISEITVLIFSFSRVGGSPSALDHS